MKKGIMSIALAAVLAVGLTACGGGKTASTADTGAETTAAVSDAASGDEAGGKVAIKMATGGQDTLPSYAAVIDVIADIEAADSNVAFEYYGARQLGDDDAILQQVMSGTLQMGGLGASTLSTYTNLMDAFTIPFLISDYDIEREAMKSEEAQAIFDKIEEDLGVKVLASYDSGMRHLANNTRPITSVDDMKGLKMRVVPTDSLIDSFTAMGANPSTMNYGEIYTGLQNKIIDGEEINITSIYSEKHYEVLKYFTEIGLYPFETVIVCNADWFNSLSPEVQQELEEGFAKGYDYVFDKYLKDAEAKGYEAMENVGVEVNKIEDVTEFKDAVSEVVEQYKNQDPLIKAFVEMVEGIE